ncbi:ubiquinone biosynthesis O-methyltransferase, mitochondrial-like [Morus notabilis]|uniref:ubiquinone biosynthesis O-methyltransferase, mitochondrial-like n=1 Tax=Morus notabilis TaxID=981085 RepID=UPI000CECE623|nr:ubiquinone biosynthesis O-methyltransferase, mitochondrial-like [Morus notabilis]
MKSLLSDRYGLLNESDKAIIEMKIYFLTEKLVEEQRNFDAVISLEVIEHVADPAEFCKSLAALTVANGATVISTINRSMRAYATAIVAAEYILHWLPKGTHQWSSFLTSEELVLIF